VSQGCNQGCDCAAHLVTLARAVEGILWTLDSRQLEPELDRVTEILRALVPREPDPEEDG
jgi:hypothetical protein